jgi:hypothetical protein
MKTIRFGGGEMFPQKYADLGFRINKFGANSKVLKSNQTPVFVFNANANIDSDFMATICDTYLKVNQGRQNSLGIKLS